MFAVMKTGGKQYKVQAGDVLRVEKLAAETGDTVQFNDILMLGGDETKVGAPLVSGAAVQALVIDQIKGEKLIHFVKRRRKHSSKRTKGHRQKLTLLRITDILSSGAEGSGVSVVTGAAAPAAAPEVSAETAAPAEVADDLSAIDKIGAHMVKKLHAAGITTYAQIAAWTDVDVEEMAQSLTPKALNRIKNEDWVGQAKALIEGADQ